MPRGPDQDQADAILTELKAIHQFTPDQQYSCCCAPPLSRAFDKVKMSVGTGCMHGTRGCSRDMVEFTDYQCPSAADLNRQLCSIEEDYIDTESSVRQPRSPSGFPIPTHRPAAMAARCAGDQHKFW